LNPIDSEIGVAARITLLIAGNRNRGLKNGLNQEVEK